MANSKLNIVVEGYQEKEAEVTRSFLEGKVDIGFELLWLLLRERPQLNFMTVFAIISSFVGDERDDYFDILKSGLLKFNPPDKILSYLEFQYYLLTQNLPRIEDEVKKLEKLKFPLDVIAKNLNDSGYHQLAIKLSRKFEHKHPKNIENLETLLRGYTELHDWIRMKKIADEILLIDQLNVSAICKLARSAIVKENYADALKHLDNAEQLDSNNGEIHLIRAVSYHFLERFKDVNLPIRRAIDSMTHSSVDSQTIASAYAVLLYSQAKRKQLQQAIDTWDKFRTTFKDHRLIYDGLMEIPFKIETLGFIREICKHRIDINFKGTNKDIEELKEIIDTLIRQSEEFDLESFFSPNNLTSVLDANAMVQNNISSDEESSLSKIAKSEEKYDWSDIKKISLELTDPAEVDCDSPYVAFEFTNGKPRYVHLEPRLFSLLWFLIIQYTESEKDSVCWFNYFKSEDGWPEINKIWVKIYGETYINSLTEAIDIEEKIVEIMSILNDSNIVKKLEMKNFAKWVIDTKGRRRANYLSAIKKELRRKVFIQNIPKHLFIKDKSFMKNNIIWNGLYKLNDKYYSSIELETPPL